MVANWREQVEVSGLEGQEPSGIVALLTGGEERLEFDQVHKILGPTDELLRGDQILDRPDPDLDIADNHRDGAGQQSLIAGLETGGVEQHIEFAETGDEPDGQRISEEVPGFEPTVDLAAFSPLFGPPSRTEDVEGVSQALEVVGTGLGNDIHVDSLKVGAVETPGHAAEDEVGHVVDVQDLAQCPDLGIGIRRSVAGHAGTRARSLGGPIPPDPSTPELRGYAARRSRPVPS